MATHIGTAIIPAASVNTNGSTTTSAVVNLTSGYSATIVGVITNGATGPNTQAEAIIESSIDGAANWREIYRIGGGTIAGTSTPYSYPYVDILYTRVRVVGNTGQSVTTDAFSHVTATI